MIIATSAPKKFKIGAELIKLYQNTEFSHVLIIKDDVVYQASHGFVNAVYIENFLDDNKIFSQYSIPDESVDMDFIKKQLGKPYSYKQIFNIATEFLFGIKFFGRNGNQQFICSELVGKALKLDWVDDNTTPAQINEYLRGLDGNR